MTKGKPTDREIRAAESVLLELIGLLGDDRRHAVLVGGMSPYVLFPDTPERHIGTFDLDVLIDHRYVNEDGYSSIRERLLEQGYRPDNDKPARLVRTVVVDEQKINVDVDFLATAYEGTGDRRRHQGVDGLALRKLGGAGLALIDPIEVQVDGYLPDGSRDSAICRVVRPTIFIVLKALALGRGKPKDAYDIHFVMQNYPGGQDRLVHDFQEIKDHAVVQQALDILADKFASTEHSGPVHAAAAREYTGEEADRVKRDAYERVAALLTALE